MRVRRLPHETTSRLELAALQKTDVLRVGPKQTVLASRQILVAFRPLQARRAEHMVAWDNVTRDDVVRAIGEYDRLGPEGFFAEHGFGPTTTYDLVWEERRYPPKAILGTAYEFATADRLASGDFEGGKAGAVRVLEKLGFTVVPKA
jgi:hypothetical protein